MTQDVATKRWWRVVRAEVGIWNKCAWASYWEMGLEGRTGN